MENAEKISSFAACNGISLSLVGYSSIVCVCVCMRLCVCVCLFECSLVQFLFEDPSTTW